MSGLVSIIDLGVGNIASVRRAFDLLGCDVHVTSDAAMVEDSETIILPGVGAFATASAVINNSPLPEVIHRASVDPNRNILGICLGMQLLFKESSEFGLSQGLGLLEGSVVRLPNQDFDYAVPNIGWESLMIDRHKGAESEFFKSVEDGDHFYFSHSYCVDLDSSDPLIVASYEWSKMCVPAIVRKGNIMGCQFHPEKSGENGLSFLADFLRR